MTTIAAFDFDGTLTRADSFERLLAWRRGRLAHLSHHLLCAPLLCAYAAGLVGNAVHKMALFRLRFGGQDYASYERLAKAFSLEQVPGLIRSDALATLRCHKKAGHEIVIVSASLEEWIRPWAETEGIGQVIAGRPQIRTGRITGRLEGVNCHGPEKARRLLEKYPNRSDYRLIAYGDSAGDREMLALSDESHYRLFKR